MFGPEEKGYFMKFSKIFGAAMLAAAVASVNATVHFYDGFETGTTGSPLDAAIWNGQTSGTDLTSQAVVAEAGSFFNTAAVEIFVAPSAGSKMAFLPPATVNGRFRRFGNISPVIDTSTSVAVFSCQFYDAFTASGAGNSRNFFVVEDRATDYDRASGLNNLIAMGQFNSYSQNVQLITANGGTNEVVAEVARRYMGRVLFITGVTPGWVATGVDDPATTEVENTRRTLGWHNLTMVYGASEVEYYVDGVRTFYFTHDRPQIWDAFAIAGNESSPIPAWYDEVYAESFSPGTVRVHVGLQDFGGDPTTIPVSVELIDSASNSTLFENLFMDTRGFVTVTAPAAGTYDVRVKASHWLSKLVVGAPVSSNGNYGLSVSLLNGDVDGDNEVGGSDLSEVSAAFLSAAGDPNFSEAADLDGDGEVGSSDLSTLSANFLLAGD